MRKLLGALVLGLVSFALTACGGEDQDTASVPEPIQLRLVAMTEHNRSDDSAVPTEWVDRFSAFTCPPSTGEVKDLDPAEYAVMCDQNGDRYLLRPASWAGAVEEAHAEVPSKQVNWVVAIKFNAEATAVFADISTRLAGTGQQIALILDNQILTAPTLESPITDGRSQISGAFTEKAANELADKLEGR